MIISNEKLNFVVLVQEKKSWKINYLEECFLFDTWWQVRPSSTFVEVKIPVVLACKDHYHGSKNLIICPYFQPLQKPFHILADEKTD